MTSSYIPQRVKRAKQQITVKLYQDQLEMLDRYGRFIDDSREYIISQALDLVFKKDKEFARWLEQQAESENMSNAWVVAMARRLPWLSWDHRGRREENVHGRNLYWMEAGSQRKRWSRTNETGGREKFRQFCAECCDRTIPVSLMAVSGGEQCSPDGAAPEAIPVLCK